MPWWDHYAQVGSAGLVSEPMQHFSKNICQLALEKYPRLVLSWKRIFTGLQLSMCGLLQMEVQSKLRHHAIDVTQLWEKVDLSLEAAAAKDKPVNTQDYEDPQPLTQSHSILNIVYFTPSQNSWLFLGKQTSGFFLQDELCIQTISLVSF